jgi:hypothetical protein
MAKKDLKNKKKAANKKVNESAEIINFLKSISQKNYSEANKYLQNVIDSKIKSKIGVALKEKLF